MLCLDIGNSRTKGGVAEDGEIRARFQIDTRRTRAAEDLRACLAQALAESGQPAESITAVSACTVVAELRPTVDQACQALFAVAPFWLEAGTETGLTIHYHQPAELGADRLAAAVGACGRWPGRDCIVIDCGTAITFCAIDRERNYRGGAIAPGPELGARALHRETAALPLVEIGQAPDALGRSTAEGIRSGLYHGAVGTIREITAGLKAEAFAGSEVLVVGTGGGAERLAAGAVFDLVDPDLVLHGLILAHEQNQSPGTPGSARKRLK
ncbi:type III pantothenate kinase [Wenzhouxiangella limi]|nr:type III pantothenate kinase [Wenzhouxiangella limi]